MPELAPDSREAVIAALAAWHVQQTVDLEHQLLAWQTIARAAISALDTQIEQSRELREEVRCRVSQAR